MIMVRATGIALPAVAVMTAIAWAGPGHDEPRSDPVEAAGEAPASEAQMLAPLRMDAARGRALFAGKGCVVCHAVNGVGGEDAPPLDAATMHPMMNPFEFAARMWAGAEAMVMLQRAELGGQIELTGQELADIIAFVHSPEEQARFSEADVPPPIRELFQEGHGAEEGEDDEAHD